MIERIRTACFAAALFAWGCSPPQAAPELSAQVYLAAAASRTPPPAGADPAATGPEGPVAVALDRLPGPFGPALFAHKAHADMAAMDGQGCAVCHHRAPPGARPPACGRCHTVPLDEETAGGLGLKGAIHVQCMECHRACGFPTDCRGCHAPAGAPAAPRGSAAPRAAMPGKVVYATPHDGGTKVSFDHANHRRECGPCAACHAKEGCTTCHGPEGTRTPRPAAADPHAKCTACHGKGTDLEFECSDCHAKK